MRSSSTQAPFKRAEVLIIHRADRSPPVFLAASPASSFPDASARIFGKLLLAAIGGRRSWGGGPGCKNGHASSCARTRSVPPPEACRAWAIIRQGPRRRSISANRQPAAPQPLSEGAAARKISVPRRRPHSIVSRRIPARLLPGGCAPPARQHVRSRPRRPGSHAVFAAGRAQFFVALSALVSRAPGRAAQSGKRPPHHAGRLPHRRGRLPDSRGQAGGAEADLRRSARRGPAPAGRCADAAVHRCPATNPRACSSPCCCVRWYARPPAPTRPRSMETRFFAPGSLVSNLDFVEGDLRQWRRPASARKRRRSRRGALDRPHRLRDSRAAPGRE